MIITNKNVQDKNIQNQGLSEENKKKTQVEKRKKQLVTPEDVKLLIGGSSANK